MFLLQAIQVIQLWRGLMDIVLMIFSYLHRSILYQQPMDLLGSEYLHMFTCLFFTEGDILNGGVDVIIQHLTALC